MEQSMPVSENQALKDKSFVKGAAIRYWLLGVVVTLIIVGVILAITCPSCLTNPQGSINRIAISFFGGLAYFVALSQLNGFLTPRTPWIKRPWFSFIGVLSANILIVIIVCYFNNAVWRGIYIGQDIITASKNLQIGEIAISVMIGLLITSFFIGSTFLKVWKKSLIEKEQFKQAQLSAQYETLNSQVNPHFLFNSLNVLSALVKKDPEKAETFIHHLSDVYRHVLDIRKEEMVTLEKELNLLKAYQFLLKVRFEGRLNIINQLKPNDSEYIVPLSLQMLLENAVKHNSATQKNPLEIKIYAKDKFIWVENNKSMLNEKPAGKGMGLENIRERYQLATGEKVIIEDAAQSFKVGLPIIND